MPVHIDWLARLCWAAPDECLCLLVASRSVWTPFDLPEGNHKGLLETAVVAWSPAHFGRPSFGFHANIGGRVRSCFCVKIGRFLENMKIMIIVSDFLITLATTVTFPQAWALKE